MDYIIFPSKDLEGLESLMQELHLSPRLSIDGKEVVMKCVNYQKLFPERVIELSMLDDEEADTTRTVFPYDTYNSTEINTILSESAWSDSEASIPSPVGD